MIMKATNVLLCFVLSLISFQGYSQRYENYDTVLYKKWCQEPLFY
jgi:hypothetical protein